MRVITPEKQERRRKNTASEEKEASEQGQIHPYNAEKLLYKP